MRELLLWWRYTGKGLRKQCAVVVVVGQGENLVIGAVLRCRSEEHWLVVVVFRVKRKSGVGGRGRMYDKGRSLLVGKMATVVGRRREEG